MFVEVISFCVATLPANIQQDICLWYSDVNTYYTTEEECMENINNILENEEFIEETGLRIFEKYNYAGKIEYIGYCIEAKNLYEFFKKNNLKTEDIPETT